MLVCTIKHQLCNNRGQLPMEREYGLDVQVLQVQRCADTQPKLMSLDRNTCFSVHFSVFEN